MKQVEYTVKITTDGPQNAGELERAIEHMGGFAILTAAITNFRVVPVKREKVQS